MYKALYRTWRPNTFEDVVGQRHITDTLKNEVRDNKIAHSYLFTGSRGTGKTTCSKILAKAVNCLSPKDGNPCGECELCRGIEDGSMTDVVEIDAASNNGVNDVRLLREEAVFMPVAGKYRVYIVDETHMLSTAAFNALLKIMEEPPEHVIFILATTEVHKVPATIISRCQRFDFRRIDADVIKDRLLHIAKAESIQISDDAATLIAKLSDGGMRDAISLLDQCSAASDNIDVPVVSRLAALADNDSLYKLSDCILRSDSAGALMLLDKLNSEAVDFERLISGIISFFRDMMVIKNSKTPDKLIICPPEELERLKAAASGFSLDSIMHCLSLLGQALDSMGRAHSKRLAVELCMVRLTAPMLDTGYDALMHRMSDLEAKLARGIPAATAEVTEHQPENKPAKAKKKAEAEDISVPPSEVLEVERKLECWEGVLEGLAKSNPPLYGALIGSKAYVQGDIVLIDAKGEMFAEMMRRSEYTKSSLRDAIQLATGKIYRLGPVKKNAEIKETGELLKQLEKTAREAGIDIN